MCRTISFVFLNCLPLWCLKTTRCTSAYIFAEEVLHKQKILFNLPLPVFTLWITSGCTNHCYFTFALWVGENLMVGIQAIIYCCVAAVPPEDSTQLHLAAPHTFMVYRSAWLHLPRQGIPNLRIIFSPLRAELWKEERTKEWHSEQPVSKHNWWARYHSVFSFTILIFCFSFDVKCPE